MSWEFMAVRKVNITSGLGDVIKIGRKTGSWDAPPDEKS